MPAQPKRGKCAECKRKKDLPYRHPKTRERICPSCYQRGRLKEGRLKGRKIRSKTRPVQSPMPVRHHEIRCPGDLIGKGVMDIGSLGSLMVGRIVKADFEGVEVDFDGVKKRYGRRELSDLVFFTEAAKNFKEEQLAVIEEPKQMSEKAAKYSKSSDWVVGKKVMTKSLSVANLILKGGERHGSDSCCLKRKDEN